MVRIGNVAVQASGGEALGFHEARYGREGWRVGFECRQDALVIEDIEFISRVAQLASGQEV